MSLQEKNTIFPDSIGIDHLTPRLFSLAVQLIAKRVPPLPIKSPPPSSDSAPASGHFLYPTSTGHLPFIRR